MLRDDIIICNADKGGAVVIMDIKDYITEANRQLTDITFYKELPRDTTELHCKLVNDCIERFKKSGKLSEKLADGLKVTEPRTPLFYLLPKIHKEDIPGRPVVSSINCHTSKISEFVDHHLQPLVKLLPSYIQDTTDFINKINSHADKVNEKTFLVTMDVKSLYTNIPNNEGIKAAKSFIENSNVGHLSQVITSFLGLILTLNNFLFNDKNYIQVNGVSMGTKCAPSYANLFMGSFEERYLKPKLLGKSNLYLRYIDDIFLLWNGTKEELECFKEEVNNIHPTIKFDVKYSDKEIDFLDTTVKINSQSQIVTTLFKKPTDRQSFLHEKSYHPTSTKKSIPYSQAIRLSRICSDDKDYNAQLHLLKDKFIEKGYREQDVTHQFEKASAIPRIETLRYKSKSQSNNIMLCTTYNKNLPNINKCIEDNWHILQINPKESQCFATKPTTAYRKNKNLRNLIGQHRISNGRKIIHQPRNAVGKCSPCSSRRGNLCCKQVKNTSTFTNRMTGQTFKIFDKLNCKSSHFIYLLECTKCSNKGYVGKCETPANERINNHRSDAKRKDSIPVDAHFTEANHNFTKDAKFTFIEKLRKKNTSKLEVTRLLKEREDFWMTKLNTLQPNGFNESLNFPK